MPVRHILINADATHEPVLRQVEGAVVVAVFHRDSRNGEALARRHKAALATSLQSLLRDETLDAAIIGGPLKARADAARLAAERTLAILLEVPFAPDRAAAARLNAMLQTTRVLCVPALPLRYSAALLHAKKLLLKNQAAHFHIAVTWNGEDAALFHALDALRLMGGEIARVACISSQPGSCALALQLASGATATLFARESANEQADFDGRIETRDATISFSARRVELAQGNQITSWSFEDDAILALHRAFDEAVRSGKKASLRTTWQDAQKTQIAWLAALSAARNGKTTKL